MKVMVISDIATDLDITNGARGTITSIILNSEEPPLQDGSVVMLKHLPQCVLVKLSRTRAARLDGLDDGTKLNQGLMLNFYVLDALCKQNSQARFLPTESTLL